VTHVIHLSHVTTINTDLDFRDVCSRISSYEYHNNCFFLIRAVGDNDDDEEGFMDTFVGGPTPSQRKGA
jgi:hypothetical protein